MENIKFAIFGDCGSQEIVINRKHTRAVGFINWYSLYSKPLQDDDVYKCIENIQMSQYNIRNLKCDLEKNALNYLLEEKANYLLLDPNDCRMQLGIRGKESVYTISTAGGGLYKQISKLENWKRLTASDIPFDEYVKAIKMVCERIKEVYKSEEIILHIHKIVDVYTDGKIIGRLNNDKDPARKRSVQELLNKIYDVIRQEFAGCHVIEFPDYVLADSRHKYGLYGLHYHDLYYEYGKKAIQTICEKHPDEQMLLSYLRDKYSLKFRLLRNEIENKYRFSLMESRFDNLIKSFNHERVDLKILFSNITDIRVYFDAINLYRQNIGVLLAVRDTPGFIKPTNNHKEINLLGFDKYPDKLWYTYCGFILKGVVVVDLVSDTAEASTIWDGNICSHLIHLESHSYRKKNAANIVIDGSEYSSNGRGANIVIIAADTFEVIDSVWYDTHDPQDYFKRHVKL